MGWSSYAAIALVLGGCTSKVEQAKASLEGRWTVDRILEIEERVVPGGVEEVSQVRDDDPDGMFVFTDDTVDYTYTLSEGVETGLEAYTLTLERESAGFTRADVFRLTMDEHTYVVAFGDETANSFKDATAVRLTETAVVGDRQFTTALEMSQ